jgi:hypothetical protein
MLVGENAVAQHESRARLHRVLSEESRHELRRGFPDHGIEPRVESSKLRPESDQANSAIEDGQMSPPKGRDGENG